jgi:hypothetical protein
MFQDRGSETWAFTAGSKLVLSLPLAQIRFFVSWPTHVIWKMMDTDFGSGNNRLTSFPPGLGRACPNLAELNLSSNNLSCIPDHELAACAKLAVLKACRNSNPS